MKMTIAAALVAAWTVCALAPANAAGEDLLLEGRIGLMAHNEGPIASDVEDGPDLNLDLRYWPGWDFKLGLPVRLGFHLGGMINLSDGTSYGYTGGQFKLGLFRGLFFEGGGGIAVHDGVTTPGTPGRQALGSRVLWRGEANLGYQTPRGYSVALFFDHVSNGGVLGNDFNRGLDTYGVRVGVPLIRYD